MKVQVLKCLKIAEIALLCLPVALIKLLIIYLLFCAAVNNISGQLHTDNVLNAYSSDSDIRVLDTATFVGNTSGTGNHIEARTTVLVSCNDEITLEYWTHGGSITPLYKEVSAQRLERWQRELCIPEDVSDCYVVEFLNSVPFPDSIAWH